jgi:hypothetical protein
MPVASFSIALPRHKALLFYQGHKNRVIVTTNDGVTMSIPWQLLQPYLTEDGVYGTFKIRFNEQGKCVALIREEPDGIINRV